MKTSSSNRKFALSSGNIIFPAIAVVPAPCQLDLPAMQVESLIAIERLGDQIWAQNGSDWPQMGQIRDIFRSDFSKCVKMY